LTKFKAPDGESKKLMAFFSGLAVQIVETLTPEYAKLTRLLLPDR